MNSELKATPLKKLRHKKGWRLIKVKQELDKRGTPISWPTLLKIEHGYKTGIIRGLNGKILKEQKLLYRPSRRTLADIAKLFKVDIKDVYQDRSKN